MSNAEKMVMVPREPTDEMIRRAIDTPVVDTGNDEIDQPQDYRNMWLAMIDAAPTQQHQGEPVALPERIDEKSVNGVYGYSSGWNACLDEITKLGPLYIHPNPNVRWEAVANEQVKVIGELKPEVERLRAEIEEWNRIFDMQEGKIDALRAQLAEAHALLRDAHEELVCRNSPVAKRIEAALSASAEPSAPVEIDERAVFDPIEWLETEISAVDTWYRGSPSYERDAGWMKDQALRLVSEARAALEHKQQKTPQ